MNRLRWASASRPPVHWLPTASTSSVWASSMRGSSPSRGSLLQALSKVTSFNGNNIIAPTDPAQRNNGTCYLLAQIQNGQFQRINDPALTGSTHGYRCDYSYYSPPS